MFKNFIAPALKVGTLYHKEVGVQFCVSMRSNYVNFYIKFVKIGIICHVHGKRVKTRSLFIVYSAPSCASQPVRLH